MARDDDRDGGGWSTRKELYVARNSCRREKDVGYIGDIKNSVVDYSRPNKDMKKLKKRRRKK